MSKEEVFLLLKKVHVNQKVAAAPNRSAAGHLSMDNARNRGMSNESIQLSQSHVQLHNFIKASEMVMNDVKMDPFLLVSKMLASFYSGLEKIKFSDFKKFFIRFESYFQGNDA